ncbi:thiol-activated cytolysin family protein [Parapedobacter indicus]|uniref:Thiol-activated cytolysin n=1 Tax=Parapedobacter indicus TaxID=1477437 RepID=A0A1I3TPJ5_9SPHI|nr:thiol-activated cytolysin family protein [Parapedobacter indicus]PPK99355.1 thiol-activated cytolysin [Parapedobacter indicus]SFJ72775.1 Thiol-activated cytolysin [Parapedobacter indicus]
MAKKMFIKRDHLKIGRVKPAFTKVKLNILHRQEIKFREKDTITLEYKRGVLPYTEAVVNRIREENSPGWKCAVDHSKGIWSSDQVVETNDAISKIFLGGVYDMRELAAGNAATLPYARKPLTVMVDSHHFKVASQEVPNPTKHEIRAAINKIIRSKDMPDVAVSTGTLREFDSYASLLTNFSGSGHYFGFGGSHRIEFNSTRKTHKFYLEAKQLYYTVSVSNTANEPEDFFYIKEEDPGIADAVSRDKINPNWVFVDSIGYGRMLYFVFESDESYEGMDIDLKQYADYWVAAAELEEKVKERVEEKNVSLQVFAMGGSPLVASIITHQNPGDIKKAISNYLKGTNDEVPISYSLRTLDMHTVGTKMYVDYESRKCHPKATKYKVIWESITCAVNDDGGDGEQVNARVRIRALDKSNKDIMDEDRLNKQIIEHANAGTGLDKIFWTFSKGNSDNPFFLKERKAIFMNKSICFPMKENKAIHEIGIRVDITEYDSGPNDNFLDDHTNVKINEIDPDKRYTLTCRHDESEILFGFRIVPLYD